MKFALYLKSKGVISAEQLVAALEIQQDRLPPIGQLAIEENLLTPREVFHVLCSQSDAPGERFGDTAIDLGLMTQSQLHWLLAIQLERREPLEAILVEQRTLSQYQMVEELTAYRREMEGLGRIVRRPIYATAPTPVLAANFGADHDTVFAAGI
jgi:hypothetical protein